MNSINWPASSIWVFIAQLGEHCSANAEATGSNSVEAPKNIFSGYFRNCLNCDSLRWSHTHSIFSSFNLFSSSWSGATDDEKQFQCCKIVFSNKARPLFLVNGLNPGVSVACLVWSSGWVHLKRTVGEVTDVSTTWAVVIFRVKEDDYRSGCRNVSHCHQQFFSELNSSGRSH